jgi:hypothetical protein
MGEKMDTQRILVEKPEGTRPLGELVKYGKIILSWNLEN